jgi:DNA repair exonuclease SbcCD nuclease subunit
MFTDIHVGARGNSEQHLNDCIQYIEWFIELAKRERATHIAFLGDYFENRSSINVQSLNVGTQIMRRLNSLGIPIIFMVGNHDLYHRNTRKVFSTDSYKDLENVLVVSEPMELTKDVLVAPYLFKQEYLDMADQINSHKYVFGHFEFRGFVVTGDTKVLEHGPDASAFTGPKFIFSGHFHKRQVAGNVIYIGNTFPTNFGDAWDTERGASLLDMSSDDVLFFDYPDAPLFYKLRMTELLANQSLSFKEGGRVRCTLDLDVGYTDVQTIREEMIEAYKLREFLIEEDFISKKELIAEGLDVDSLAVDLSMLHNTIGTLIREGVQQSPTIDPDLLISIFDELKLEK